MIEILKSGALSSHPKGPHFILTDDAHVRETADGESHISIDLPAMLKWLEETDPEKSMYIEAFALLSNNAGLIFLHGRWLQGERELAMLFQVQAAPLTAGDGQKFHDLCPLHPARILGLKRDFPAKPGSYQEIESHLIELLALHGLRPNMDRINTEFCTNCRGGAQ